MYEQTQIDRKSIKLSGVESIYPVECGYGRNLIVTVCVCVKSTEAPRRAAASAAGRQLSSCYMSVTYIK